MHQKDMHQKVRESIVENLKCVTSVKFKGTILGGYVASIYFLKMEKSGKQ